MGKITQFKLDATAEFLGRWYANTIRDINDNLEKHKSDTTYKLRQSIGDSLAKGVTVEDGVITAEITMEDYWENVDMGQAAGTWVPYDDLREWVHNKGIGNSDSERDGIAYAIRNTIHTFGTGGTHFVSEVLNEHYISKLESDITEILGEDLEDLITNQLFKGATKR